MRALQIASLGLVQSFISVSRLHDSLKVAKNNNVEIQCGCVLLLIWKMTLLDFFGSKFCKKCECGLASVLKRCRSFRES